MQPILGVLEIMRHIAIKIMGVMLRLALTLEKEESLHIWAGRS